MNEQSFFVVMPIQAMADSVADDIRAFLEKSAAETKGLLPERQMSDVVS